MSETSHFPHGDEFYLVREIVGFLTHPRAHIDRRYGVYVRDDRLGYIERGTADSPTARLGVVEARATLYDDGYESLVGYFNDIVSAARAVAIAHGMTRDDSLNVKVPRLGDETPK